MRTWNPRVWLRDWLNKPTAEETCRRLELAKSIAKEFAEGNRAQERALGLMADDIRAQRAAEADQGRPDINALSARVSAAEKAIAAIAAARAAERRKAEEDNAWGNAILDRDWDRAAKLRGPAAAQAMRDAIEGEIRALLGLPTSPEDVGSAPSDPDPASHPQAPGPEATP